MHNLYYFNEPLFLYRKKEKEENPCLGVTHTAIFVINLKKFTKNTCIKQNKNKNIYIMISMSQSAL